MERSLYTKYRPRTMEQYKGPEVKRIVSKRFRDRNKFPHVVLIQGPRGTGKTTLERILSKYYLCTNPNEDGTPCEKCEMCQQINDILIDGQAKVVECPGVTEVDVTNFGGKDAIQDIIDDAKQAPIYTKYKIIAFDECHKMSSTAQNSLLNILEDIPEHLVIIFCTTNPEKLLQTIKSRCQLVINARKQSISDMTYRLLEISKQENFTVSKEALDIISKKGNRVPRECITLLEDVAIAHNGKVTLNEVMEELGGDNSDIYIDFVTAANSSLEDILNFVYDLRDKGIEVYKFAQGLTQFVMEAMYIKHGISLDEYTQDYIKTIKKLYEIYTSSDFDVLLQIIDEMNCKMIEEDNDNGDSSKNEMVLTVAALKMGKVDLLAHGLAHEQSVAVMENKKSLYEHSKMLRANNDKAVQQLKVGLDLKEINETFDDIKIISNSKGILDNVDLSDVPDLTNNTDEVQDKTEIGSKVDTFFD